MPKVLLVYPKNPVTFWSYDSSLELIGRKSVFPPLGLLTVAGLLPADYDLRLVDLNADPLNDEDMIWADAIITSSMIIHWPSLEEIIARANALGRPILCGGPLPTQYHADIAGDAVFYLGEAENGFLDVLEEMMRDPEAGRRRRIVDRRGQFLDLENTPLPRWDLIDLNDYATMMVQITRGCPESCTFCNIPSLYGKTTRLRSASRTTRELSALYDAGWRGLVMAVDDNFVGNRTAIRTILEQEIIPWQRERGYPFQLYTQASIRLCDDPLLMEAMRDGGFETVFVGIESPSADSLRFMGAQKNLQGDTDLIAKVRTLQSYGFHVQAGFIVGLDTDPPDIAEKTIDFVQEAGIPVAMAGILGVLPDTPDYKRYQRLGRLVEGVKYTGDSGLVSRELSFVPNIDPEELFARHEKIVATLNRADRFFERCLTMMRHQTRRPLTSTPIDGIYVNAMFRAVWRQGVMSSYRRHYWRFLSAVLTRHPRRFVYAFKLAVLGHHQITAADQALRVVRIQTFFEDSLAHFERFCQGARHALAETGGYRTGDLLTTAAQRLIAHRPGDLTAIRHNAAVLLETGRRECAGLEKRFRDQVRGQLERFHARIERLVAHHTDVARHVDGRPISETPS